MSRQIGPIPGTFNDKVLKRLFIEIQRVLDNFQGYWLKDGSLPVSKLAEDVPLSRILWPEWHIPLATPAEDVVTTSTDYVRCSGIFPWDPTRYPLTGGAWYFEAYIAIADAAQTVAARLMGATEVVSVSHTGSTLLTVKRSAALTMPTSAANLYVEFKTSNASYPATFAGARLIFVPY